MSETLSPYEKHKREQRERGEREAWIGLGIVAVFGIVSLGAGATVLLAEGHVIDLSESMKRSLTATAVTSLFPIIYGIVRNVQGERVARGL